MVKYVGTRDIDAPVEAIFDYRLDVRNLPDYNPDVRDVEVLHAGDAGDGSIFCFRLRIAPGLSTRVTLTVRNVHPPAYLEFDIQSLMNAREVCFFEATERGEKRSARIRFEYTVETPGGLLAPLLDAVFVRPSTRRQVERELDLIKQRLEESTRRCWPT